MKIFKDTAMIAFSICFVALILSSCSTSSTTAPSTTSSITMTAETDGSKATSAFRSKSGTPASGIVADSIEITRVRFLLSAVKLHVEGNDTLKDSEIKTGPFILDFTPGFSRVFSNLTVPSGTYEKIKFEIHKFPSSIDQLYLNDPTFTDFVTAERSTVIVEGRVWSAQSSIPTNFVYKSQVNANVEARFEGLITLSGGSNATLAMVFHPLLAFKATQVLDPRDPSNANDIDNFLKSAMKAVKK
ncbi:MAG: hypothetical protein ABI778_02750 [Ignavibacteriota bacterium]